MATLISTYVGKLRETLQTASLRHYKEISLGEMAFCFTFYCLLMVLFPTEPPDDLLRHMKAYTYSYDYRQMWPYSPGVPGFNMYYLFDAFAGSIHQLLGPNGFVILQILVFLLYGGAVYWLLKDATSRNWRFTLTMIILSLVFYRLFLARPATFEGGFCLLGLAACAEDRVKPWMHFVFGCLMASFYYLFFLYLIPLAFYRRAYIASLLCGVAGWLHYGGGEYVRVVTDVFNFSSSRDGIQIAETQSIVAGFMPVLFVMIPVLIYWRNDIRKLFVAGWFCLSNQVRYLEVVLPILASYSKYCNFKWSQTAVALVVLSLCFFRPITKPADSWIALKDVVPPGSRILCLDSDSMFKMVYGNERLRIAPSMEVAWDTPEVRKQILAAKADGKLVAGMNEQKRFDFVVESDLKEIPKGVELYRISGKYRIWKPVSSLRIQGGV